MINQYTLSAEGINKHLKTEFIGKKLYFFDTVSSTFDACEKLDVCHGAVVCAKTQTSGCGRMGRQWQSDMGGIYFSLIIKPDTKAEDLQLYTTICALGVQRGIAKFVPCCIKWPNDIVSKKGKKLCGILTKIKFSSCECDYINVGIGINANNSAFAPELKYASSLGAYTGGRVDENAVLCEVLCEIEKCLKEKDMGKIADEYAKVCITLGSKVRAIYASGEETQGVCIAIENDGSITIQKDDMSLVNVNSGEVSVRGIYGDEYV